MYKETFLKLHLSKICELCHSERIINASTLNSPILFIAKKLTEPWMEYLKRVSLIYKCTSTFHFKLKWNNVDFCSIFKKDATHIFYLI